jgi:hypothetical protein
MIKTKGCKILRGVHPELILRVAQDEILRGVYPELILRIAQDEILRVAQDDGRRRTQDDSLGFFAKSSNLII